MLTAPWVTPNSLAAEDIPPVLTVASNARRALIGGSLRYIVQARSSTDHTDYLSELKPAHSIQHSSSQCLTRPPEHIRRQWRVSRTPARTIWEVVFQSALRRKAMNRATPRPLTYLYNRFLTTKPLLAGPCPASVVWSKGRQYGTICYSQNATQKHSTQQRKMSRSWSPAISGPCKKSPTRSSKCEFFS